MAVMSGLGRKWKGKRWVRSSEMSDASVMVRQAARKAFSVVGRTARMS